MSNKNIQKWLKIAPFSQGINLTHMFGKEMKEKCMAKKLNIFICSFKTPLTQKSVEKQLEVKDVIEFYKNE